MQTFITMKERSFCRGIAKVTGEGQKSCELQCRHFKLRGRRNAATEWARNKSGAVKPALSVLPTLINRRRPATGAFTRTL